MGLAEEKSLCFKPPWDGWRRLLTPMGLEGKERIPLAVDISIPLQKVTQKERREMEEDRDREMMMMIKEWVVRRIQFLPMRYLQIVVICIERKDCFPHTSVKSCNNLYIAGSLLNMSRLANLSDFK